MPSDPKDDPDERERLLWAHKYRDAIALDDEIAADSRPWENRALAHFCLGELDEGLSILAEASEAARQKTPGAGNFYCNLIAVGYWCLGDRKSAVDTLEAEISGLLDRSIRYADGAGGASPGLLLWWMQKRSGNEAGVRAAIKYLKNRAKRKAIVHWPGPIARYLLGEMSELAMLQSENGPERNADIELLNRRYMIQAQFYMAAKHSEAGDLLGSDAILMRCACLENPFIAPEWYLARYELGMDLWWKPPAEQH